MTLLVAVWFGFLIAAIAAASRSLTPSPLRFPARSSLSTLAPPMLRLLAVLPLTVFVTACAPTGTVSPSPDHPASAAAPSAAVSIEVAALEPAEQPDLPAPLRPDGHPPAGSMAGMDPAEMEHGQMGAMDHDRMTEAPTETMEADEAAMSHTARQHMAGPYGDDDDDAPEGLASALDAYLAVQDALASDRQPSAASIQALDRTLAALAEAPPESDPHFWHLRAEEVRAVQAGTTALGEATNLNTARVAFGELSAPFAGWVEALGVPEGYDVARFTCGMFDAAPEGGVWLQREGATRNPYFGSSMLTCGAQDQPTPSMDHERPIDHEGMDHEEMDHEEMDHDGMNRDDQ